MRFLAIALLIGCGGTDEVAENVPDAQVAVGDPQLPPQGHALLKTWLAERHYESWRCEDAPHPARPPGAHGTNRICNNGVLSASANGTYPVGAASVKELYQSGRITGFAVGLKLADGDAASSWYWYEAYGDSVIADGANRGICVNCHAGAPRDYVFTHVR
ncbi:MAG: hypothetical protein M4D80_38900 [Myxococcota bacterium]|nr:hypothetical protein [Deltaproteobacteria bacterium]MDQ3341160.1 hypothetical protein [Myxococcota bacterium]